MLSDALRPAVWTLAASSAVASVTAAARLLWGESVVLETGAFVWLVLLAAPASFSIAVPAAGAVGVVSALARWVEEGAWAGARACGVSGRRLVPAAAIVGILCAAATMGMSRVGEPWVKRTAGRVTAETAAQVSLWPGTSVVIGDVTVRAEEVQDGVARQVFLASDGAVGTAARARVVSMDQGAAIELLDGVLAASGPPPWRMTWGRWLRPLPRAESARVELDERTNEELGDLVRRMEEQGRDASYERSVLHKRWLHPFAALLLPVALLPIGAMGRPVTGLTVAAVGYLLVVRVGDHLAPAIGSWAAASAGPLWVGVLGLLAWTRWGDR
jgi:lipopolysaccharide export LptBFGC system permease protein LptF